MSNEASSADTVEDTTKNKKLSEQIEELTAIVRKLVNFLKSLHSYM